MKGVDDQTQVARHLAQLEKDLKADFDCAAKDAAYAARVTGAGELLAALRKLPPKQQERP